MTAAVGMFTDQEIAEFRADSESLMGAANGASNVRVRRRTGRGPLSPGGAQASTWRIVHDNIPARLGGSGPGGGSSRVVIGDVVYENATSVLAVPATTVDLADDDLVEVIAGTWTGAVVRVVVAVMSDLKVDRRVPIVEAARPTEWGPTP